MIAVCVEYRYVNVITIKDVYPLPRIDYSLARLEKANIFSIVDLESGYWNAPLNKEIKINTAFVIADGLYQFLVMSIGLCSAPGTFERMMDLVVVGLLTWTT